MNWIEKVFVDMGKLKMPKEHNLLVSKTIVNGLSTTLMINYQLELISKLSPVKSEVYDVPLTYDSWELCWGPNSELNKAQHMNGHFTAAAVTSHKGGASQLVNE